MTRTYLTHSMLAWISMALIAVGLLIPFFAQLVVALPVWLVPVGYFLALAGSALLFVGWVRWKVAHPEVPRS
ncbi:hypothetical protein [Jannaschia aquimarina]|uniref:DUF4175 domain-containing protein n=1 Tax=Jannaschia aquimarina TaxID=935700 RepID=A0A0D1CQY8_9RHOB|nr:hypothetical protein [Jannaschia aquimarina]KIT17192.1 hypothetical protein jaqu_09230 [Jannaschia aquimarina]SNT18156.1 hypothetical protein SAMN05421775_10749 [Jannaschia aquimarina]